MNIDAKQFEQALRDLNDAQFECGEWDRDESDEPFDAVCERARLAELRVWEVVGLPPPIGALLS